MAVSLGNRYARKRELAPKPCQRSGENRDSADWAPAEGHSAHTGSAGLRGFFPGLNRTACVALR